MVRSFHFLISILFFLVGISHDGRAKTTFPLDSLPYPMMAKIDSTEHLVCYKPEVYNIDLVCCNRPDTMDENILFCAEAAFTGKMVDSFYYKNIAGDFVTNGMYHRGYECGANSGGFIFYKDGTWKFLAKSTYQSQLRDTNIQCAYEQAILIENGIVHRPYLMKPERVETYRVLCENDKGELMVVTSRDAIPYAQFVQNLLDELHVRNALYMDMGRGWNYSWYRNEDATITTLFPMAKWTQFQTNWLVFRK